MIINAGIREVVFENEYEFSSQTKRMFREAGVKFRRLSRPQRRPAG